MSAMPLFIPGQGSHLHCAGTALSVFLRGVGTVGETDDVKPTPEPETHVVDDEKKKLDSFTAITES